MTPLEVIQLTHSGLMLWSAVGPLVEQAMKNGVDVTMDDVEAASKELGSELDLLKVAIELKKIRDAK